MLKEKIGRVYEDVIEMQQDLECELSGEVYFGDVKDVPFSYAKRMDMWNEDDENTVHMFLDFVEKEGGIKLIGVYGN